MAAPLWAAIDMILLTVGFIITGLVAGRLTDRFGARRFATVGLVLTAASFIGHLLMLWSDIFDCIQ